MTEDMREVPHCRVPVHRHPQDRLPGPGWRSLSQRTQVSDEEKFQVCGGRPLKFPCTPLIGKLRHRGSRSPLAGLGPALEP